MAALCRRLILVKFSLLASVQDCLADDQTNIIADLNDMIAQGPDVYTGGRGVLVRNPYDAYEQADMYTVVPSTFWSNDIFAPSQLFPATSGASADWDTNTDGCLIPGNHGCSTSANPDCPNNGWNGYFETVGCSADPGNPDERGPWNYAGVAYVVGSSMSKLLYDFDNIQNEDWGWGVFYPTDSNSVDWRCRWLEDYHGWDCRPDFYGDFIGVGGWIDGTSGQWKDNDEMGGPGGFPPGNPDVDSNNGGGTGCHLDKRGSLTIDQTDAFDSDGESLVLDNHCQCNYAFRQDWKAWVYNWIDNAQPKPSVTDGNWLGGGDLAPSRALDMASCWVNNVRDMIILQNEIYWARDYWLNYLTPLQGTDWNAIRNYWGWNEIPVKRLDIINPYYHDATIVKIPADMCGNSGIDDTLQCLSDGAQLALERDFDKWVADGYIVPGIDAVGLQPGSYIAIVREYHDDNLNWQKWFFCEDWWSPNSIWQIVYIPPDQDERGLGACYLEYWSKSTLRTSNSTITI